jgi:hypothetical protein
MGRKARALKASLAAAFIAAGGAAASQAQAAANPDAASVEGIVSSYFGGLGLRDDFQQYLKFNTGFDSFFKFYKEDVQGAVSTVLKFSFYKEVPPPPGFGDGEIG